MKSISTYKNNTKNYSDLGAVSVKAFPFSPHKLPDGTFPLSNCGSRYATDADMERFWRESEPELDRLTLELCAAERAAGKALEDWLLKAELDAFKRTRKRAA